MASHIEFRNEKLFCTHCGASYDLRLPQSVSMITVMVAQYEKEHKYCEKTWKESDPAPETSENQAAVMHNINWWIQHGEHGISSKTLLKHTFGYDLTKGWEGHPADPDDFRRCYLLIKAVPQIKGRLNMMRDVSPVWSRLVDNWDKLTTMLEEQIATGKKNGIYEYMRGLGC